MTSVGVVRTDDARARDLARMKRTATACLVAAGIVYVLTVRAEQDGAATWVGYLRAAAEAGMIGGLADWFAVTALFRRPLGLPIPHTALIPTRKAALGQSLADFVSAHFLTPDVVRERLGRADLARRLGTWLSQPAHAERVGIEVAGAVRAAAGTLRDDDLRAALEDAVLTRLADTPVAPALGSLLDQIVVDGAHHGLVDVCVGEVRAWLVSNPDLVVDAITAQAPEWSPRFLDQKVAEKVYTEVLRVVGEVAANPRHDFRQSLDAFLVRLATDLRTDPATIERTEAAKRALLQRDDVRQAFGDLLTAGRRLLIDLLDDPGSELRRQLTRGLAGLGERLTEPVLAARVERWVADGAGYLVTHYSAELTSLITDTVDRWDGDDTSRRIELHVGRDLQFIRINGTVVGALAGVAIHAATLLL